MTEVSPRGLRAQLVQGGRAAPSGRFTSLEGEEYYQIADYDRLPPFLMSVPSDTDIWMFVSSSGGLTAGRWNAEGSLFPYETVDRLHQNHAHTGPITLIRVATRETPQKVWEPFSDRSEEEFRIARNLYKNGTGNRLIFEEINLDLELTFRYRWSASHDLGLVRTATLTNFSSGGTRVSLLDGLRNVLPYGAPLALYQSRSSLVDAYRRTDLDPETQMGIFSLTSKILDRAEAAEELRANTVWCHGLPTFEVYLGDEAVRVFRQGRRPSYEGSRMGRPGSYLVSSYFGLEPGSSVRWHLAADIGRSHVEAAAARSRVLAGRVEGRGFDLEIERSLDAASGNLRRNVASADGLQLTGRAEADVHHYANVLYNNMRGGVFARNHEIPVRDFADFVFARNRVAALRHGEFLRDLADHVFVADLVDATARTGDPDLERLSYEYLPLRFGRRHGDPSRPWNRFELRMWHPDGSQVLRYEGNWRDIFQNWEALALSFPRFLPNVVAKFVNASTVDGFNPYRITRDGFEWERVDPADPWSYIGYWGDHQIVYLLRLLEMLPRVSPGSLDALLGREIFVYARVPYRIRPYVDILEDPHSTIVFDGRSEAVIEARMAEMGTDGALVPDAFGSLHRVSLFEKLLVPALSKISNFVPDAGIWMNTQRPEWNDANNALVGDGVSVVTLCYLRRYLHFLIGVADGRESETVPVSTEVVVWFERLDTVLREERDRIGRIPWEDVDRRRFLDRVGMAFSDYRETVYSRGFSGKTDLSFASVGAFSRLALEFVDPSIRANKRQDELYHSYNLLVLDGNEGGDGIETSREHGLQNGRASIRRLSEMLEGQVAVLGSGLIGIEDAARVLDGLFSSRMYRPDQRSFLLYPETPLPSFLERNVVPRERVRSVPLLRGLLQAGDGRLVAMDAFGLLRFTPDAVNAGELAHVLDTLEEDGRWRDEVVRDRAAVLALYEEVFDHRHFTGRSGAMYGFEGLGCVYWHMVAKLLLAVQELILDASDAGTVRGFGDESVATDDGSGDPDTVGALEALVESYYRIRSGLGYEKNVAEYGAFPTDPYSHTPPHGGAAQPGMTGQVKEEILTRFGELGVRLSGGLVQFSPVLLRRSEFLRELGSFHYYDLHGEERSIEVDPGALAFTFCQVPIVYTRTGEAWVRVTSRTGESVTVLGKGLDEGNSQALLDRRGEISRIDVGIPEDSLREG